MKRAILCLALACGAASAASADPADRLAEMLAAVPELRLFTEDPLVATFLDMDAVRSLDPAGDIRNIDVSSRLRVVGDRVTAALYWPGGDWSRYTGVDPWAVTAFIVAGEPPATVILWGMRDDAAAGQVLDHLPSQGFEPVAGDAAMLGLGGPLMVDFAAIDPANPWRGRLGMGSFVSRDGGVLVHAAAPETVEAALRRPGLDAALPVAAALAGIDALPADTIIVQAVLFTPMLGAAMGFVPGAAGPVEIPAEEGLLPYQFGVLFDAQLDGAPVLGITLVFADCGTAADQAQRAADLWTTSEIVEGRTFQDVAPLTPRVVAGPDGGDACAATALLSGPSEDLRNAAFRQAYDAVMRRDFPPIAIAGRRSE